MSIKQRLSKLENSKKREGPIQIEVRRVSGSEAKQGFMGYIRQKLHGRKTGEPKLIFVSRRLAELEEKYPGFPYGVPDGEINNIFENRLKREYRDQINPAGQRTVEKGLFKNKRWDGFPLSCGYVKKP